MTAIDVRPYRMPEHQEREVAHALRVYLDEQRRGAPLPDRADADAVLHATDLRRWWDANVPAGAKPTPMTFILVKLSTAYARPGANEPGMSRAALIGAWSKVMRELPSYLRLSRDQVTAEVDVAMSCRQLEETVEQYVGPLFVADEDRPW